MPDAVAQWSLTSLRENLIKIGAKVVRHACYTDRSIGIAQRRQPMAGRGVFNPKHGFSSIVIGMAHTA